MAQAALTYLSESDRQFVHEETARVLAEVGVGGHHLGRRSTRDVYRAGEIWQPRVLQRGPFEAFAERPLVSEAAEQARELLDGHVVAPLPDDVVREIDAVIGRYARSVGARRDRLPWQR